MFKKIRKSLVHVPEITLNLYDVTVVLKAISNAL